MAAAQSRPAEPVVTSLTLFAGSASGLWRSRDWGGTWQRARSGAAHAILPLGPRVIVGGESGLLVSDDFGETWTEVALPSAPVLAVLMSRYPQADPTVFVGTGGGLLKSGDAGRTFAPTPLAGTSVSRLEWPGPELVAATGRGVLVSTDAGGSFSPPGAGLPDGGVQALALSSFFAVDPVMFAGGSNGVFRSSDRGRAWAAAGLEGHVVNDLVWLGPLLYAASDRGLLRTEDAGRTWVPLNEGLKAREATRLLFPLAPDSGAEAFLGTDSGVFRTSDGGINWRRSGMEGERVLALATFPPPAPMSGRKKR